MRIISLQKLYKQIAPYIETDNGARADRKKNSPCKIPLERYERVVMETEIKSLDIKTQIGTHSNVEMQQKKSSN